MVHLSSSVCPAIWIRNVMVIMDIEAGWTMEKRLQAFHVKVQHRILQVSRYNVVIHITILSGNRQNSPTCLPISLLIVNTDFHPNSVIRGAQPVPGWKHPLGRLRKTRLQQGVDADVSWSRAQDVRCRDR